MAEETLVFDQLDIAARVNALLDSCSRFNEVAAMLKYWSAAGVAPIIFGGFVRDLVLHGSKAEPRDVDIVFTHATAKEDHFSKLAGTCKVNRFGGMQFKANDWKVDLWNLESTWGFRATGIDVCPENLPKTTFLNIEAIALQCDSDGRVSSVYDGGFLDSINNRLLDINLAQNPFPALSAVRAIVMARKLGYAVTSTLAEYVIQQCSCRDISDLVQAQSHHYGQVMFDTSALIQIATVLSNQLDDGCSAGLLSNVWDTM